MSSNRRIGIGEAIREAIAEEMQRDPNVFLIGEDIGIPGGFGGAFGHDPDHPRQRVHRPALAFEQVRRSRPAFPVEPLARGIAGFPRAGADLFGALHPDCGVSPA